MIIYKLTCPEGKSYVGATTGTLGKRLREHKSFAKTNKPYPISQSIRKHGLDKFSITILQEVQTRKELKEREEFWIKKLETMTGGYNLSAGPGANGFKHTLEQKKASSLRSKIRSKKLSSKYFSNQAKKMWLDEKVRARLVDAAKKRSNPIEMRRRQKLSIEIRNAKREYLIEDKKTKKVLLSTSSISEAALFCGVNDTSFYRYVRGDRNHSKFYITKRSSS